jgi:hypothetical protein
VRVKKIDARMTYELPKFTTIPVNFFPKPYHHTGKHFTKTIASYRQFLLQSTEPASAGVRSKKGKGLSP